MLTLNRFLLHIRATESSYSITLDHPEDITMPDLHSPDPLDKTAKHRRALPSTSSSSARPVLYYDNYGHPLEIDVKQESLSDGGGRGIWEIIIEP